MRVCVHVFPKIVEFLRKREDFVDLVIKHIGTSAIMDLLLRMLTCIEPQQLRQDVLNVSSFICIPCFVVGYLCAPQQA